MLVEVNSSHAQLDNCVMVSFCFALYSMTLPLSVILMKLYSQVVIISNNTGFRLKDCGGMCGDI